jgi:hypothetical protein
LRYLNGTKGYGILYSAANDFGLFGYMDSDWEGSVDDRKSTSGYVFHLGSRVISWVSKKQPIVSLSTTKVKYLATNATCQGIWLRRTLANFKEEK